MPASDRPTYELRAQLTVPELYVVLGYAWFQVATSYGEVMAAHNRLATACKAALRAAGEPDTRIYERLAGIMHEMGVEPSA